MWGMISFGLSATPQPPLNFSVRLENGQFTVRWGERIGWQQSGYINRLYTVTYYPSSKKRKVCRLICDHHWQIMILVKIVLHRGYYMPARGYEFYLRVVNSISHKWAQRTSEISSWTLEDKIHIHKRVCNVRFIIYKHQWNTKSACI